MDILEIRQIILDYLYPKKIKYGDIVKITKTKNKYLENKLFVYAGRYDNIISMIELNHLNKETVLWYCIHHLNFTQHEFKYISTFGKRRLKQIIN